MRSTVICILLVALSAPVLAGDRDQDLFRELGHDVSALPSTTNLAWLLAGTALTLGAHAVEDADGAARALDQGAVDLISDSGNIWGDMFVQAPLALVAWGGGTWSGHEEVAGTGYAMARGLAISYVTVGLLKRAIDRERPNGERYSFPSGHTAAAFTTAGVLTRRHGGWLGGASLALGVTTAMGRMEDMKHYAGDTAAGATIGWIVGRTVARGGDDDPTAWRLLPAGRGLVLTRSF
ncbi:MAG: phosphatase PAP2 family protein [bacterium]|nr:phosphatase PAP2 family protein [bacterium]